jgi:hypothetical protein
MLDRAIKWFETAKGLYQDTLFEENACTVRANAGHICDLLSIAVAFVNGRYFVHGQTSQLDELSEMKKVPTDFTKLYRAIILEPSPGMQKQLCHEIIRNTGAFLDAQGNPSSVPVSPDFSELAAWYQELIYTWRRVYHWCEANDPVNAYIWCCTLQSEVDEWGGKFGITDTGILCDFNADDLSCLRKRAETVEEAFRQAMNANGVRIKEYGTVEDFLKVN